MAMNMQLTGVCSEISFAWSDSSISCRICIDYYMDQINWGKKSNTYSGGVPSDWVVSLQVSPTSWDGSTNSARRAQLACEKDYFFLCKSHGQFEVG